MRRFLSEGPRSKKDRGMTLVSWNVVHRLVKEGGLGYDICKL